MSTAISTLRKKSSAVNVDQSNHVKADQGGKMLLLSLRTKTTLLTPETKKQKDDNFIILQGRSETKNLLKENNNGSLLLDDYSEDIICGNSLLANNLSAAAKFHSALLSQVNGNEDTFFLKNPKCQKIAPTRSCPLFFAILPRPSLYDTNDDTNKNDDN
eukprot:10330341-Ditylum_brightwellii.AAC.1